MTMTVRVPCDIEHSDAHTHLSLPDAFVRLYQDYKYVREDVGTTSVCAVVDAEQSCSFRIPCQFCIHN